MDLERLKAAASSSDYASMVRLAAALYQAGYDERVVLRGCYGASFPDELFVIALEAMRPTYFELDAECYFTDLPWNLVVPAAGEPMPERGDEVALELVPCHATLIM